MPGPPSPRPSQQQTRAQGDDGRNLAPSLREESSRSTSSIPSNDNATESSSAQQTNTPQTPFTPNPTSQPATHGQGYFRMPASPRSAMSSSNEPSTKAAKVAIPRLKRSAETQEGISKPGGRHRVTHACEPCRHRKTKCSGERPMCRHCLDFKIQCYYADGKRDRVKKQFGSMTEKVADYEKILRDLTTRVSDEDASLIRNTLERASQLDVDESISEVAAAVSLEVDGDTELSGAESEASAGAGSTGALDRTEEDFTREGAKTTGFMGKNSEITWIQRLRKENKYGDDPQVNSDDPNDQRLQSLSGPSMRPHGESDANLFLAEADSGFTIHDSSYHLNDINISTYEAVDPFEVPTQTTASNLFHTYFHRVHPEFPVVGRLNLQNQFTKFISRPSARPPTKWLAILNMIFAISAKYSHLIQAEWRADERDHLIYFTRARMLAVDNEALFNHPDLQIIQIYGLMAFYLMVIHQTNRSWQITGLAIRCATALGLNMRNESQDLSDSLKEIRYRVWWALYNLEHRLCSMTGRANCILDEHCTTPLPVPVLEEEFDTDLGKRLLSKDHQSGARAPASNKSTPSATEDTPSSSRSGSKHDQSRSPSSGQMAPTELEWAKDASPNHAHYFLHLTQLCRLNQQVFNDLYNPSALEGSWSDIQKSIGNLNQQLEGWYRKLPPAFDFRRKQRDRDYYEARLALGFYYYSTKQMLNRPCLCRLDRKIPNQSSKSSAFNNNAAITCVTAAQDQMSLIPDEPNAVGLLRVGPWSSILHMLVQSAIVLMLEMSFRAHHMPEQAEEVLEAAKKAIRWLHALGHENLAAARAWKMCNSLLGDAAKKIGHTIEDMPDRSPRAARSSPDDTSLSSNTTAQQMYSHSQGSGQGSGGQMGQSSSTMAPSVYGMPPSTLAGGGFGYGVLDPTMQYDQYFPTTFSMGSQMQYVQQPNQSNIQYEGMPADTEMNFMDAFTEQRDNEDNNNNTNRRGGNRDSRSGFG